MNWKGSSKLESKKHDVRTDCLCKAHTDRKHGQIYISICNVFLHIESSGSNTAVLAGGIVTLLIPGYLLLIS